MMDDYKQYEAECERIRQANALLLDEFETWLIQKNLTAKTAKEHVKNIDFYINHFLLYEDPVEPPQGADSVGFFSGLLVYKEGDVGQHYLHQEQRGEFEKVLHIFE